MHDDDIKLNSLLKGGKTCKSGQILREGYTATRKKKTLFGRLLNRGTTYRVGPTCIKNKGNPGKGPAVIGPLKQGDLKAVGYSYADSADKRHTALAKAVGLYGRLSTLRKLNAVAVLNKTVAPTRANTYRTDRNWISKTYFQFKAKDLIETMDFTYTNPEGFTFTFTFSFDFEDDYFDGVDTNDESS